MIFCYRCDGCDAIREEEHRAGRAPATIRCPACGRVCTRAFSAENKGVNAEKLTADSQYPYVSKRLPRCLEGCMTNDKGQPVIESRRHEREIMARHGYSRE